MSTMDAVGVDAGGGDAGAAPSPGRGWRFLGATPGLIWVTFGVLVVGARLSLGEMPAPYDPDPKTFDVLYRLHRGSYVVGLAATVVLAVALPFGRSRQVLEANRRALLTALGLIAAFVGLLSLDPGGLATWLVD